jgi:hypothetical protein
MFEDAFDYSEKAIAALKSNNVPEITLLSLKLLKSISIDEETFYRLYFGKNLLLRIQEVTSYYEKMS